MIAYIFRLKKYFIKNFNKKLQNEIQSLLDWYNQTFGYNLTELPDKYNKFWTHISHTPKLSEEFIREFKDFVNWGNISIHQKLSENFIREFKDNVYWNYISEYQKLSESFIREFKNDIFWNDISQYQKLSEPFIKEFKDKVNWNYISEFQKLSESFIREFKDSVNWSYISKFQKLSDEFWKEFKDQVNWGYISQYQKLSDEFWKEFIEQLGEKSKQNLLYWTNEEKLELLKKYPQYKIEDGYVYAFKGIRSNRYSKFNFQFKYEIGQTYECHADYNLYNENSFGLSCWTYEEAKEYCDELVIEVRFKVEDLAAVVHEGGKLRVSKFEVLT
jgi:hypothetical protein